MTRSSIRFSSQTTNNVPAADYGRPELYATFDNIKRDLRMIRRQNTDPCFNQHSMLTDPTCSVMLDLGAGFGEKRTEKSSPQTIQRTTAYGITIISEWEVT